MRHFVPYWLLWCRETVFGSYRIRGVFSKRGFILGSWDTSFDNGGQRGLQINPPCPAHRNMLLALILTFSFLKKKKKNPFREGLRERELGSYFFAYITYWNGRLLEGLVQANFEPGQGFQARTLNTPHAWLMSISYHKKRWESQSLWYQREPINWVFPYYKITSMCKNYHNVLDAILKASNVQTNSTKVIKKWKRICHGSKK